MAKRNGGISCAMALVVHALTLVLVFAVGMTQVGLYYTEWLLVLAGSTTALVGGLVLGRRSRSQQVAICLVLVVTTVAVSWMLWQRNRFGFDEYYYWYNPAWRAFPSLPKAKLEWRLGTVGIAVSISLVGAALAAIQAVLRRATRLVTSRQISRRTLLIGTAVLLYIGYLIQSQLIQPRSESFEPWDSVTVGYMHLPFALIALVVLAATFYLPGRHWFAWLLLFACTAMGVLVEIGFRSDISIRGNITGFLILGFAATGTFLRVGIRGKEVVPADRRWCIPRTAMLAAPALLLVLGGYLFVRTVDLGQWIALGDYGLSAKIAEMREFGAALEWQNRAQLVVRLDDNVAADVFARLMKDFPAVPAVSISVIGMRTDLDVAPLANGPWTGVTRGRERIVLNSGEISENQLRVLLEKNDVAVWREVRFKSSATGLSGAMEFGSVRIVGSASEIISNLAQLNQNTDIKVLHLQVLGETHKDVAPVKAHELLELLMQKSWGKELIVQFCVELEASGWKNPTGDCPWENVVFQCAQNDWQLALELVDLKPKWPIDVGLWNFRPNLGGDDGASEAVLRATIATNGEFALGFNADWINNSATGSLEKSFERLDCVLRRDESGNPVSLLALVPDWLTTLDDVQAQQVESLLIGTEWVGIWLTNAADMHPASAEDLARFSGLKKLGLGQTRYASYSFVQQMPGLTDFQIPGETAPELQAEIVTALTFLPELERFTVSGMPGNSIVVQLGQLKKLREVVIVGVEVNEIEAPRLDQIRKRLPGVEVRVLPDQGFGAVRPAELIQHQAEMIRRLTKTDDGSQADSAKEPEQGRD